MTTAKLFKNGQSQAVRLPREFALPGKEVYVRRIGRNVLLVPKDDPWDSLVASLEQFTDDFMSERLQPDADMREAL